MLILSPHLTLTSGIPDSITDDEDPARRREWLDTLAVPARVRLPLVRFQTVDVGQRVTQKIRLGVLREEGGGGSLIDLAVQLRASAVEGGNVKAAAKWAESVWMPHVSLLYADISVGEEQRLQVIKAVKESGIWLYDDEDDEDERNDDDDKVSITAQWNGGRILWVDTRGDIPAWTVLGERDLGNSSQESVD